MKIIIKFEESTSIEGEIKMLYNCLNNNLKNNGLKHSQLRLRWEINNQIIKINKNMHNAV